MAFRDCFCAKGGLIMWPLAQNCSCKAHSAPELKQDFLQLLPAVPSHLSRLPHLITSTFLLPFFLVLFPSSPPVPPSLVPFLVLLAFSSSLLTYFLSPFSSIHSLFSFPLSQSLLRPPPVHPSPVHPRSSHYFS